MKTYLLLTAAISAILILFPLWSLTTESEPTEKNYEEDTVSVFLASANKAVDMETFDYIVGAVASEMPASYETEALKAQAVACYSYMLWVRENSDNAEYDITNDPSTHQGYLTEDEMKEKWGDKYESYKAKIEDAVSAVYGKYMTYDDEVILALFHAISPGKTQNSEEVWEAPLPYIKSKSAPGDSLSPDFDSTVTVTCDKIRELFSINDSIKNSELIDIFSLSDTGFIKEIKLGNKTVSAGELASKLSLRSPYFTAEYKEGSYIFKVKGYGHGLGMSQYSADYMARQGSSFEEILKHFYSDIEIFG
jgi:stage II sporulation protein D